MNLNQLTRIADSLLADYRTAKQQYKDEKIALKEAKRNLTSTLKVQNVLQNIAQQVQQEAHAKIGAIVSKCLETIFGDEAYGFRFEFERRRGKTEARAVFLRAGKVINEPMKSSGGGPIQVAAFALRIANIILTNPPKRRILIMDEAFGMLNKENSLKVKGLLEGLSKELDMQFVLVTHNANLECGKVISL